MIFVANYKMNGNIDFYKKANKIFNKLKVEDTIVLCPPFVYMPFFKLNKKNVYLGAQDVAQIENKTSTGQISAKMLTELGAKYCIVGHSERRELFESNEIVAQKVKQCHDNDLVPIVCVGEKTKTAKLDVLIEQVEVALSKAERKDVIFAYEPIWAIGSGEIPTVKKINTALNLIKKTAKKCGYNVRVLYGGSVKLSNSNQLKTSVADGFLMGGVSLNLDEFINIVRGE